MIAHGQSQEYRTVNYGSLEKLKSTFIEIVRFIVTDKSFHSD